MEFKGNEFIRNIEIEKEKAELKRQSEALESEKKKSVMNNNYNDISLNSPQYFQNNSTPSDLHSDPVLIDIKQESQDQDLDDILLTNNDQVNQESKKKYIILSIALIILFILTIIIIQLLSNDKEENILFVKADVEKIKQDKIVGSADNQKYQKIIDKKTKKKIQKELDLDTIVQKEIPLPAQTKQPIIKKVKKTTTDVFGMETTNAKNTTQLKLSNTVKAKEIIKKTIKAKTAQPIKKEPVIVKRTVKDLIKQTQPKPIVKPKKIELPTKVSGIFIQVGAFTKTPSKTLINKIKKAKYNYIVHKMNIKGTMYNKVLIGPYSTTKDAKKVISKVKKDLKSTGAYILRLK